MYMNMTILFKHLFSETAWPIKAQFYVEPRWKGETSIYKNGLGHITKMAAMHIYDKNFKNLLLQNKESDKLLNWEYGASGTQGLQIACK